MPKLIAFCEGCILTAIVIHFAPSWGVIAWLAAAFAVVFFAAIDFMYDMLGFEDDD